MERPHENSYWVEPGRLLAGEYPGAKHDGVAARDKIGKILDAGVTFFVDLTHPGELAPYEELLHEEAAQRGLEAGYRRLPIRDVDVPRKPEEMVDILDTIDGALAAGQGVYVHCWGGVGRTGTVVGCYLVRRGLSGEAALAQIADWWQGVAKSTRTPQSPETSQQMAYVRQWPTDK
jgi:hypothetical protein